MYFTGMLETVVYSRGQKKNYKITSNAMRKCFDKLSIAVCLACRSGHLAKRHQISYSWSYNQLYAAVGELGIELRSCARASVFNHSSIIIWNILKIFFFHLQHDLSSSSLCHPLWSLLNYEEYEVRNKRRLVLSSHNNTYLIRHTTPLRHDTFND